MKSTILKSNIPLILALGLTLGLSGCAGTIPRTGADSAPPRSGVPIFAITDVSILNPDEAAMRPHRTVVTADGKIVAAGPSGQVSIPANARIISGAGKFIVPGLIDMHAHLATTGRGDLDLFLSQGVTTIRNMAEFPDPAVQPQSWMSDLDYPSALELRRQVAAGEIAGPRIIQAGHVLDGPEAFNPRYSIAHGADTDWQTVIAAEKAAGFDYLKVYWNLTPPQFGTIMAQARSQGMQAIGHVPASVDLETAAKAGLYSNEHLTGFYDPETVMPRLDSLLETIRQTGMWNCPTLVGLATVVPPGNPLLDARKIRPEMAFIPQQVKDRWEIESRDWGTRMPPSGLFMEYFRMLAGRLAAAGCGVVAGTDCGMPWVVPGFSLHEELALLSASGLGTRGALAAATSNAARCLKRQDLGVIRTGAAADLVLLDSDPADSLAALRDISGVMAAGVWHERRDLDARLDSLAAKARKGD